MKLEGAPRYRCSAAARWMPRALAGALVVAGTLVGYALDPDRRVPLSTGVRTLVMLSAAAAALWLVRASAETGTRVDVARGAVRFSRRGPSARLPLGDVSGLDYDAPFASRAGWLPALVLIDRHGRRWRVPAFIRDGGDLLERILRDAGRAELRSWAEARRLAPRMRAARFTVPLAYLAAVALVAVAVGFVYG